ncbi:MAG: tetratricopeptide repeat protein [Thioalkalispiraceae bacterium]|jgi:predicted negative regulator of RcsB-dependent stress response
MSEQLTDEEQVEALKKWWKENGVAIVVGIIIGIGAIIGFWKWNEYKETRALVASALYDQFMSQVTDAKDDAETTFTTLKQDYEGTPYAALAALRMAQAAYKDTEKQKAIEYLRWSLDHSGHESISHIARIRLSKLLIAENKLDEVEQLLKDVKEPAFDAQYSAIRGDLYSKRGNIEQARKSYQSALDSTFFSGKQREFIQMKLNNLGVAELSSISEEAK